MFPSRIRTNPVSFFILIAVLAFTSCKKEGPAGPSGPAGPAGTAGAQGTAGTDGAEGSVDIVYSDWIDIDLLSGIYASFYYGKIEDERITQDILDKGVIKMYVSSIGNFVYDIPHPTFVGLYMRYSPGKIEIFSPTDWDAFSGYRYRFVLIPAAE